MWLWDSVLISLHRFSCLWRENLDSDFPEWPWTLSDISFETAPVLSLGTALKSKRLRSKGELGVRGSSDGWGPSSDDNLQMAYCCGLRWGYPFVLWCAHENVRFSDFFFLWVWAHPYPFLYLLRLLSSKSNLSFGQIQGFVNFLSVFASKCYTFFYQSAS